MTEHYNVVVVGGGTAGCVVAARLSEDPDRTVLLLEAGPDYPTEEAIPDPVRDGRYVPMRGHAPEADPRHDWALTAEGHSDVPISVPQGRLVGGGSAINGMISLRGATADYREWAALGNPHWDWPHVLAAYRALEDDAAPGDDIHGRSGPFPLVRAREDEYGPLQAAFVQTCRKLGVPDAGDFNAPDAEGVGPVPMNRRGALRMSTALTHLAPARTRPNLTVRGEVLVRRVTFDGTRATGVELADGTRVGAGEVILCAGAIQSPALLQRSGIGPRVVLARLGVPTVAELPAGHHLGDHFSVPLVAPPREGAWSPEDFSLQTALRTSTTVQPGSLDAQLTMFAYLNVATTGDGARGLAGKSRPDVSHVAGIGCVLNKPRATGTVSARSLDPAELPRVRPNYLGEQVDRDAMREIVRLGWQVITSDPLSGLLHEPMGIDEATIADDAALDAAIRDMAASGYHFTGTCRMAPPEHDGVVDEAGLVHGCQSLRVADASVIPVTPAANTMLPTVMTAERLAAAARGTTFGEPR
ncbi:GMC family oxidoreductase N-terminal domain-containing protein [Amycolatopsis sp. NPDC006131]|uniref:GMC family oxidoreductase n=1 Tax=Amycolatopsis sp. NPDC006131 TaxID=3156731 RepID=UPI0033A179B5